MPRLALLLVSLALANPLPAQEGEGGSVDVPLALWTSPAWPAGVNFGPSNGVSMGDYDGDGWVDVFLLQSGNLWRNVGGQDWELAANLLPLMPAAIRRYGSSFGDYDNDGLPDIGCEPRDLLGGDSCFRLLHNLGGGPNFVDVAGDPSIVDFQECGANAETICWGDVDGDRNLDMILPIYPPTPCGVLAGPGNAFYYNLGPTGPGGAYAFTEMAEAAGLANPPGGCRPEGAQLCDVDFDGDLDFYTGGALYRNLSAPGTPFFDIVTASAGIQFSHVRDEGLAFLDVDMDGDLDLVITYIDSAVGVRIYEARGDGTFALLPASTVEDHTLGIKLGLSYADWDGDGDVDFTTRGIFRRNMFLETGVTSFATATHAIPPEHLGGLLPAWGDWDLDGDVDVALAPAQSDAFFYENVLYDAQTPAGDRRYVRVRPVNDSATVAGGLETEYGATVEVRVAGDAPGVRRRQLVSSASGYLNQNEYTLHFGLPPDPAPAAPLVDLLLDVCADFPSTPDVGYVRVDRLVNPVLGGIQLATLSDRTIHVFRSGKVILDGYVFDPSPAQPTVLTTTNEGLRTPTPTESPGPLALAAPDQFVGIELDTLGASAPVRLTEVILDGEAAPPAACVGGGGNVLVWDVTTPGSPALVAGFEAATVASNDRSYLPINALLQPGGVYRVVAAVRSTRASDLVQVPGPLAVAGGMTYTDADPCSGIAVESASLSTKNVPLALRFHPVAGEAVVDLGHGLAGALGVPLLTGSSIVEPGQPFTLQVSGAAPNAPVGIVVGGGVDPLELLGGVLVPTPQIIASGAQTDALGELNLPSTWPTAAKPGSSLYFQVAILDLGAPHWVSFSNAVAATTQP